MTLSGCLRQQGEAFLECDVRSSQQTIKKNAIFVYPFLLPFFNTLVRPDCDFSP